MLINMAGETPLMMGEGERPEAEGEWQWEEEKMRVW